MYVGENRSVSGTGDMVLIDKGSQDGMKVGDVLLSARERTWATGTDQKDAATAKTNYLIAQLLVVKTTEGSSTCRILRAYEEVTNGDIVTR